MMKRRSTTYFTRLLLWVSFSLALAVLFSPQVTGQIAPFLFPIHRRFRRSRFIRFQLSGAILEVIVMHCLDGFYTRLRFWAKKRRERKKKKKKRKENRGGGSSKGQLERRLLQGFISETNGRMGRQMDKMEWRRYNGHDISTSFSLLCECMVFPVLPTFLCLAYFIYLCSF